MSQDADHSSSNEALPVREVVSALNAARPVRLRLPDGGRIHIDRPLPFLCVHQTVRSRPQAAAEGITVANAAYLVSADLASCRPLIEAVAEQMIRAFGDFAVLEVAELAEDTLLEDDSPYLPPFEVRLSGVGRHADAALHAIATAIDAAEVKYRTPQVRRIDGAVAGHTMPGHARTAVTWVEIAFAPVYRQPRSEHVFPDLLERVVTTVFDAGLHGLDAFVRRATSLEPSSHRALGRQVFIKAVQRVDQKIDAICGSFDFLLAVTPINTRAAWVSFRASGFERMPRLLYRPLATDVDRQKRELFSIAFEQLEDPVLARLYTEKQEELDMQLSMLRSRETMKFRDASRVLYGSIDDRLATIAGSILDDTAAARPADTGDGDVDCYVVKAAAHAMIDDYRRAFPRFDAKVEIRDDLPAGLMVCGPQLLISRQTRMHPARVGALLSHEIGVHLLTYFNGDAQGLRLFRSGLAGYEGMQEGLAVFAEYAAGGMTLARLRLVAARVLACQAMLAGADFVEAFRLLVARHGFSEPAAFNVVVRVYRSGGFAKDAIYLRGLLEVLAYLGRGGRLEPLWFGKLAASHLTVVEELSVRGLLKPPPVRPAFLSDPNAQRRIHRAREGLAPTDLVVA